MSLFTRNDLIRLCAIINMAKYPKSHADAAYCLQGVEAFVDRLFALVRDPEPPPPNLQRVEPAPQTAAPDEVPRAPRKKAVAQH